MSKPKFRRAAFVFFESTDSTLKNYGAGQI